MKLENKGRYMACSKCRGTKFEVYLIDRVNNNTPQEIKGFHLNMGNSSVRRRCSNCGLENSTIGIFKI